MPDKTNVSVFPGAGNVDPIGLLEVAKNWGCDEVVIIGIKFDETGTDTIVGASCSDLHRNMGFLTAGIDELNRLRSRPDDGE